jgi:O-antigen/teichoic acid export membrane protein
MMGFKLRGLNYGLTDQAITSGSNFFCALLLVKILGLTEFGIFSTLWIILLFISTINVNTVISPMMAIFPGHQEKQKYNGSLLIFQLSFSLTAFLLSFIVAIIYLKSVGAFSLIKTALLFSICVFLHHFQEYFRKHFFATKRFSSAIIIDSLTYLIRLFLIVSLVGLKINMDLSYVFLIYSSTSFLGVFYGISKYKFKTEKEFIKKDFHAHLIISKWLAPSGILKWSSINVFTFSSSIILGPTSIGIIKLSQNIASSYNLFLLGLENIIPLEAAVAYSKGGLNSLVTYLKKTIIYGLVFTILFAVLLVGFSNYLFETIYGKNFIEYSYILNWFASFLFFMYTCSIINIFLITISKTKITFLSYLITSIFSVIIFYPLIYYFEIRGVLIGMLASYGFLLTVFSNQLKRLPRDIK